MTFVLETKGLGMKNDKTVTYFKFLCDTAADLPLPTVFDDKNIVLAQGCEAVVIDPKSSYKMKSDGTWIIQDVGNDYYSKSEIDDKLQVINDLDDMQDRALAELYGEDANQQLEIDYAINTGAKNLIQNNCNSKTLHGVTATTNADGSITVSGASDYANNFILLYDLYAGDSATSSFSSRLTLKPGTYINKGTGRSDVKLQILEYNTASDYVIVSEGDTDTTFSPTKSYFVARLWISSTADFSTPVTVYPMIIDSVVRNATYQPYAPTNRELYELCETKTSITDIFGVKPTIAEGTNLNDMTTPGVYACGGASVAITLGNCPTTTDAFIMCVDHIAASTRTIQRLYCMNTANGTVKVYIRGKYSGGWAAWYKFEGTAV